LAKVGFVFDLTLFIPLSLKGEGERILEREASPLLNTPYIQLSKAAREEILERNFILLLPKKKNLKGESKRAFASLIPLPLN